MSDTVSIKDSKCIWYDTGGIRELCMVPIDVDLTKGNDWWAIFFYLGPKANTFSCAAKEYDGHGYIIKSIPPDFIALFPRLKDVQNKLHKSPNDLLKAFGDIVYSYEVVIHPNADGKEKSRITTSDLTKP